uniref:Prolactin receptor n=1 Tax=Neogobius melanostomus TaxID=47308 RepID=A0A8C6T105_9GOBI
MLIRGPVETRIKAVTMMKEIILLFLLFYMACGNTSFGPPGKPTLTNCRSPEKETFTCWWKPGSDGGLPTIYALFYLKDNSDTLYECPDYHTAGKNSCFFNKNETSVWVNYNITVVATNQIGRTFSDPVDVDVAYIVQPHTPENVTVNVMENKGWPFLRVSWESPHKADIRSGWITLVYELRSRMEGEVEWEEHFPGQQKTFNIFSIRSGSSYLLQVRCKPDHGFWSEWSSTTKIKVPEYFFGERYLWILIAVFSSLVFLILAWILYMNSRSLKNCILPPVPGPKIKGFDHQSLKNGSHKDSFNSLMIPEIPPNSSSNYEDLLVEYLEVFISGDQELSMEEGKDMQDFKSESSTCDSDSGRGSCDSQTLLTDKCKEVNKDELNKNCKETLEISHRGGLIYEDSTDTCNERVKTWPCLPQYASSHVPQMSSLKMVKQHCLSDTLLAHGSLSSNAHKHNESFTSTYWDFSLSNKQPSQIHPQTSKHLQAHSDINICKLTNEIHTTFKPIQYVEVQTVNEEGMVLLQPVESVQSQAEGCPHAHHREDYSKVKGVRNGNTLLLERGVTVTEGGMDWCVCDKMETSSNKERDYMSANTLKHQDASMKTFTMPFQEQKPPTANGYVDTAMMFSVSM